METPSPTPNPPPETSKQVGFPPNDPLRSDLEVIIETSKKIQQQLDDLTSHYLLRAFSSTKKILLLQFLRGTAFGLGSFLGASIVVYILVFLLSKIEFVPVIGGWIEQILEEIQG